MRSSTDKRDLAATMGGTRRGASRRGETDLQRLLIDAGVGAGLALALALVFVLNRGASSSRDPGLSVGPGEVEVVQEGGEAITKPRRPLRLGVTPPEYDDIGKLLGTLGSGYRYRTIALEDLLDADRLGENDVVFLTCGTVPSEWGTQRLRAGDREGSAVVVARPDILDAIETALRTFVGRGGTLYVSDWRIDLLAVAFPEFIDRPKLAKGAKQTVTAEVVDPGLKKLLGAGLELRFDKPSWRPAAVRGDEVTTYLQGSYELVDGRQATGPLLVKFPYRKGMVIFTSFHNEMQNSEVESKLLRYLVFATVTAREEEKIRRTMVRGGFSPKQRNLLSASSGGEPVTERYECREGGNLEFVLGFEDQGARLKLAVVGPDGTRQEKTGTKTFQIDVADAAVGQWQYTITPLEVPHPNFPFTLTIGEKR